MALAIIVLFIEFAILFLCFCSLILVRICRNIQTKRSEFRKKELKELWLEAIHKEKLLFFDQIPKTLLYYPDVLNVVEEIDRLFLDSIWKENKDYIINTYIEKKALAYLKSYRWRNQTFGLRGILLSPKKLIDKAPIAPFLNHSRFLVRILAASSMVEAEKEELLLKVIKRMLKEAPMARFAYRDLLINSNENVFRMLNKIAHYETNDEIICVCLDILCARIVFDPIPLAVKYIASSNPSCRSASIKVFSKIPGEISEKHLVESLLDEVNTNRAEAAQGLGDIHAFSSIPGLSYALRDSDWDVRCKAAWSLKELGERGRAVLYQQSLHNNPEAYEAAKYILDLP